MTDIESWMAADSPWYCNRPLTDLHRDTIVRMYVDGHRYSEIARALNRNIGTIGNAVYRYRRDGLIVGFRRPARARA